MTRPAARVVDIPAVARAALPHVRTLVERWAPGGRVHGAEYVARNPIRSDSRPGSFKVNITTGRWADFATGDRGGDLVSLAAYLHRISQVEAARRIAAMLIISGAAT
jgi:hypothetical protein